MTYRRFTRRVHGSWTETLVVDVPDFMDQDLQEQYRIERADTYDVTITDHVYDGNARDLIPWSLDTSDDYVPPPNRERY
jgi:hypothetical protein